MDKEIGEQQIAQMSAEAKQHLENFKREFSSIANRLMGDLVSDYLPFIESDAWTNYRQYLQNLMEHEYMVNAQQARISDQIWARNIRRRIYNDNKEEFTTGLVADLQKEISELKEENARRRMF